MCIRDRFIRIYKSLLIRDKQNEDNKTTTRSFRDLIKTNPKTTKKKQKKKKHHLDRKQTLPAAILILRKVSHLHRKRRFRRRFRRRQRRRRRVRERSIEIYRIIKSKIKVFVSTFVRSLTRKFSYLERRAKRLRWILLCVVKFKKRLRNTDERL